MFKESMPKKTEAGQYLTLLAERIKTLEENKAQDEFRLKEIQADTPVSNDDVGSQRDERERLQEEIDNTEELIREAKRALHWIKENGLICAVCKEAIETERLDVDPASVTCKKHRDMEDTVELPEV